MSDAAQTNTAAGQRSTPIRRYRAFAVITLLLTLALGTAKLALQKAHPPAYAVSSGQVYEGFVSIDYYSQRAARLLGKLPDDRQAWLNQRDQLHPTSWLVPMIVAMVAALIGSIPIAFAACAIAALLAEAYLIFQIVRQASTNNSAHAYLAVAAFLSHITTCRTAGQLYLDHFSTLLTLYSLSLALRWTQKNTGALTLYITNALGLFTKASFLPTLAVPALATFILNPPRRISRTIHAASVFGLLALAPACIFLAAQGFWAHDKVNDLQHLAHSWNLSTKQLQHFAIEIALLFQWIPVALIYLRRHISGPGKVALYCALTFLLSTWAFGLPAIPRLYLPALALLIVAIFHSSSYALSTRTIFRILLPVAAINYVIAGYGIYTSL